ncbi:MAG: hypothetical protein M3Q33_01090 [Acidobacteriota bacterium]|nr:hypothetical protein [Acidobacteriota bacterium]
MKRFLRNNGLSLAMFGLFFFSLVGQYLTGFEEFNENQLEHGQTVETYIGYFGEGHFIEAVFENWESEFLQMGMYIILTVFLYQKGSSESKTPDTIDAVDIISENSSQRPNAPFPVKRGGILLKLYENSLGIAFFTLFAISFLLHGVGGAKVHNSDQLAHGREQISTAEYFGTSRFWFESFQNWQSEFLSIGAMVVLSIFLRQKGSPESKPVESPHSETGN